VLLVGDASFDPKGVLGDSLPDLVPTWYPQTRGNGDTASDHLYACVSGDDPLPDLAVGRLAVSSAVEVDEYFAKLAHFQESGLWTESSILLVADDGFSDYAEQVVDYSVPPETRVERLFYQSGDPPGPFRLDLVDRLRTAMPSVVAYVGHGGRSVWAHEPLLHFADTQLLDSGPRLTFQVAMTCLNGFFDDAESTAILAEGWVETSRGGALACLAPSREQSYAGGVLLGAQVLEAVYSTPSRTIGESIVAAKLAHLTGYPGEGDSAVMNNLLGDPAVVLFQAEKTPAAER
jgi:hypothetical protein